MTFRLDTNLNPAAWDEFLTKQPFSQVLQSSTWQKINKQENKKVWAIAVLKDEQVIMQSLIIKQDLPLGFSYLYAPHGPVSDNSLSHAELVEAWKYLLSSIREICGLTAQEELFFKFEPNLDLPLALKNELPLKEVKSIQPAQTTYLDLTQNLETIEKNFHAKTRYNIKVAKKHGLNIRPGTPADLNSFWQLLQQTTERDGFRAHSQKHYQAILQTGSDNFKLWLAEKDGQMIAANLYSLFGDTITYVHGASNHAARALMAPFLLHWEMIQQAKQNGFHYYDFYGIAPLTNHQSPITSYDPKHPWAGFTRFKLGWGGEYLKWPPSFDLVLQPSWYKLYQLLKKLR